MQCFREASAPSAQLSFVNRCIQHFRFTRAPSTEHRFSLFFHKAQENVITQNIFVQNYFQPVMFILVSLSKHSLWKENYSQTLGAVRMVTKLHGRSFRFVY